MLKKTIVVATLLSTLILGAATPSFAKDQCGGASWYSMAGSRTASGERMNPSAMTAAHKTLPFGTRVRVVDQTTGKAVTVTINDRGPFIRGRIIDLSKAAATQLGIRSRGHSNVCIVRV